ncbi:hypothetical protein Gohar_027541 [Gossypium harknessii]|uniref:RNase H type-1 domain-containing protein n=1 Tax=Gossypium harknessii TaxID=34285 RepID=A0A7J9HWI9_9ROSI|nr:hypothetical protein [Gossypium harknessii]
MFVAEALACVQGLQLGLDLDLEFTAVEVEGEALLVVKKLQKGGEDKSEIYEYIKDGQCLSKGFQTCMFKRGGEKRPTSGGVVRLSFFAPIRLASWMLLEQALFCWVIGPIGMAHFDCIAGLYF